MRRFFSTSCSLPRMRCPSSRVSMNGRFSQASHQSAVIRKLEVMGEAAGKVSTAFCASHPEIPWKQMTGLRHRLIHDYGDVRLDIVWRVVRETLPGLVTMLRPLIPPKTDHDD